MATKSLTSARRRSGKRVRFYRPRHPGKYQGDPDNIQCLSSWEYKFCEFLDNNPNVLKWSSESLEIPYVKPTDGRVHRYFPDFWIQYRDRKGQVIQEVIEVKPASQIRPPRTRGKKRKTQLYEGIQYAVNLAKWKSAQQFCAKYGMKFRLVTENQLFK